MKINKAYRPEVLVSKGKEPNPLLTDPYLDATDDLLVATDGHALVALPVETDKGERSRYLACSLLQAARVLGDPDVPAEIKDQEVIEFGVLWPTAQERTFPDWKKVRPSFKPNDPGTITLTLNARLLRAISTAMATDAVYLTIETGRPASDPGPILVSPTLPDAEEFGLLMPIVSGGAEDLGPGQSCPVCHRLLAGGAPCPEHGSPPAAPQGSVASALQALRDSVPAGTMMSVSSNGGPEHVVVDKRAALVKKADAILRIAGSGELTKGDTKGEAVAPKKKGRR